MEWRPDYGDYSDLEKLKEDLARNTMRQLVQQIGEILKDHFEEGPRRVPSSAEILREMIDELKDLQRSPRHITTLWFCLRPFVETFPRLEMVSLAELTAYLRELKVGPRRRDNVLCSIIQLSRFARQRNYLPEYRKSAAEKIRRIKPAHEIQTWSPAEAMLLLEYISPRWFPFMILGLFAGLRTSEIFRLDWSAIKFEERIIAVSGKVARKIRISRLVPIQSNLFAYLDPYRDRIGPIYPLNEKTAENLHGQEMNRIRLKTGLPRKDNANRHSYGSYRLAITKNVAQVALEMGNSPRQVIQSYNDPKSEADAAAYFAVPEAEGNVVTMGLPLEFDSARRKTTELSDFIDRANEKGVKKVQRSRLSL